MTINLKITDMTQMNKRHTESIGTKFLHRNVFSKLGLLPLVAILLLLPTPCSAQGLTGIGEYKYSDATQLWRLTENAAGLSADSARGRGIASVDYFHHSGNLHRVQEGGMSNDLTFFTESYQKLSNLFYGYGKFSFNMGRTKDRAWSDVRRSYNSDPFFSGSDIKGKYDRQDIDITASLGTRAFGAWRFGVRLDYHVGDLSRLRDPRSRSEMLQYQITPGVTYTIGRSSIGLAGHYNRYKEKIPNITTVQTDATLRYYTMTGMENAQGITSGYNGFQREWVNHRFGAELSYAFHGDRWYSLNSATIDRGNEDIFGQYKYEPGHYRQYIYGLKTRNRITSGNLLHEIDFGFRYEQSYADEYRQELETTTDPDNGLNSYHYNTILTFKKRFQVNLFNIDLRYRLNFTKDDAVRGYVGAEGDIQTTRNKYLLHTSKFKYESMDWNIHGGYGFVKGKLWAEAKAGLHTSLKNDLCLYDNTTDYAQNVLIPDQDYYGANWWTGRVQLTYQFPLTIKKTQALWFVRAYGDYAHANNHQHASTVGATIGLYY